MPMVPYFSLAGDKVLDETRCVRIVDNANIPDGVYAFMESYCDEEGCDCRRVMLNVVSESDPATILAVINYGWEPLKFYARWLGDKSQARECKGPVLDGSNVQSEYAQVFLDAFEKLIIDPEYVERLEGHYRDFKRISGALSRNMPIINDPLRETGRNDPCPCGSGKKYKRCCL